MTNTIVLTDPPWPIKFIPRKVRPNQKMDYPTMTMEEIKEFHREHIPENAQVFMWTIEKYLPETEQMMKDLGYQVHVRMIWDKGNGISPAMTVRYTHEYLIWFFKKGNIIRPACPGKYTTVIRENHTNHSHKPEAVYAMLEDMFPTQDKIELFSRYPRVGWKCFGNENKITGEKFGEITLLNEVNDETNN